MKPQIITWSNTRPTLFWWSPDPGDMKWIDEVIMKHRQKRQNWLEPRRRNVSFFSRHVSSTVFRLEEPLLFWQVSQPARPSCERGLTVSWLPYPIFRRRKQGVQPTRVRSEEVSHPIRHLECNLCRNCSQIGNFALFRSVQCVSYFVWKSVTAWSYIAWTFGVASEPSTTCYISIAKTCHRISSAPFSLKRKRKHCKQLQYVTIELLHSVVSGSLLGSLCFFEFVTHCESTREFIHSIAFAFLLKASELELNQVCHKAKVHAT